MGGPAPGAHENIMAEMNRKNEKIQSLEAKLQDLEMQASAVYSAAAPFKAPSPVTSEDVAKINTVTEKMIALNDMEISAEELLAAVLSKTDLDSNPISNAFDLMIEAKMLVQTCLARGLEDSAANACLERLATSMKQLAEGLKEGLIMMAKAKSQEDET